MAKFIQNGNKIIVKLEVSTELKRKIGLLLNQLMKDYKIKGKDKSFEDGFKHIFKSNLYVLLDNEYHNKD